MADDFVVREPTADLKRNLSRLLVRHRLASSFIAPQNIRIEAGELFERFPYEYFVLARWNSADREVASLIGERRLEKV